ncbi:type I methionyl aminopeptidase [Pseudoalteromonas sp. OOF1S-7]|uniref:type I methionyl aminopeptidase n=1 Tax=Pseudoalteromonas sp. OOF1S-7 TaxID=2917757 RepID=UPI001EF58C97|nr:type I methionyl aminopeptidase [Pseudoalteromonas sp. OOF1S-7]MCG7535882.1 type I methionyl aminopeptidase [Pseudoalteromonas sp. OOF1S-7]
MTQVTLKNKAAIALMQDSGALLAQVFKALDEHVKPGVTTLQLDEFVEHYIVEVLGAIPASKGQYGYPYSINTSVNEVVCHGMPSARQVIAKEDILNIDITLKHQGYIADSSKMYIMPQANATARSLVDDTITALWRGIEQVKPGATLGDIGHAIGDFARLKGLSVVREYCGHGIGTQMHEAPEVLHFGRPGTGLKLEPGMTFTIEPMLNRGSHRVKTLKDGWTVVTRDRALSAQAEHTILVTPTGFEVLTLREEEKAAGLLATELPTKYSAQAQ